MSLVSLFSDREYRIPGNITISQPELILFNFSDLLLLFFVTNRITLDIVETPQGQVDSTHIDDDLDMVNVSLTIGVLQRRYRYSCVERFVS